MKRRGTTIIEATVALCILAAAFGAAARLLSVCARQRQEADHQLAAQLEVDNVAEQIASMAYEDVTPAALDALQITPEAAAALHGGKLACAMTEIGTPEPVHKRINVALAWDSVGGAPRTVRLTTWKYAAAGRSP